MAESYKIEAVLSLVDNMSGALQSAGQAVQSFGDNVQSKLNGVGKAMTVAGAATTAMGMKSLKSFGQFQQSLNTAAVVAGGTAKDINGLADVANKMGADLPLSAQDASDAMVEMARNGASVGQIKEQFPAIAQAATAAGADLQMTAGVVQQAMNIWGSSIKSPAQAAEILVQTANLSNASIEDMQQGLANVGGTANMAGMSLQDTSEAIGLLTNHGFSAAQASQDLNHAILQMLAPSKTAKATMDELGISFVDAQGKMKSFPQILEDLNNAMAKLNPDQKAKALKSMFGTAGMEAIGPLMDAMANKTGNAANSWNAWENAVNKAAGTSSAATKSLSKEAAEMQKNVGSSLEQLSGNWESLRNDSMKAAQSINGPWVKALSKMLVWADKSHSPMAGLVRDFIGLAPIIGVATSAVGGFLMNFSRILAVAVGLGKFLLLPIKLFGSLAAKLLGISIFGKKASAGLNETSTSSKKAGKASSMSAGQILAMGAAIMMAAIGAAILVGSFAILVGQVTNLAKVGSMGALTFLAVAAGMSAVIAVMGVVGKMLGSMGPQAAIAYAGMALLVGAFALLTMAVTKLAQTGQQGVIALAALTVAIVAITAVMGIFAPVFQACIPGLIAFGAAILMVGAGVAIAAVGLALLVVAFIGLVNAITGLASQGPIAVAVILALTVGISAMVAVLAIFGPLLTASAVGLLAFGAAILMAGVGIGIAAAGIALLVDAIANLLSTNTVLGQIISDVWNGIESVISGVAQAVGPIVSAGFNTMKSIATGIMNALKAVISGVWNGIKGVFNAGMSFIKSVTHADLSGNGRAIMNSFFDGLKSVWNSIKSWVSGLAGWIKDHKGPVSYDRKLLIPAGQAIMTGLNRGLVDGFSKVQSTIMDITDTIANTNIALPKVNDSGFNASLNSINARMNDLGMSVDGTLSANNIIDNTSSRNFESRMEMMMQETIKKLNNVDQTPVVTVDTLNRMRDYNEKTGAQAYVMLKGGR